MGRPRTAPKPPPVTEADGAVRRAWINLYSVVLDSDPSRAQVVAQMEDHYWYMRGLDAPPPHQSL